MRILHTADVHLAADESATMDALDAVLAAAADRDADLLTVGGDLFDSEADAERLRPDLRDRFSGLSHPVLTIPGNHDAAAFREDLFFGEDFRPAVAEPFEHVAFPDAGVRVTCLPYTPRPTEDLLVDLREREPFQGTEILLLHCSLEAPFSDRVVGAEEELRYFPVGAETLAELDFAYYLAGHYHSPRRVALSNGGTFVYPGTPASVTRSETGRRNVADLDTADGRIGLRAIETFHYDELTVTVLPGEADRAVAEVEDWVEARRDRDVAAEITVTGHVAMPEAAFEAALADASGGVPVDNRTTGVERVLHHPLYRAFQDELAERDLPEDLERAVRERTLRVFSELHSGERLS